MCVRARAHVRARICFRMAKSKIGTTVCVAGIGKINVKSLNIDNVDRKF